MMNMMMMMCYAGEGTGAENDQSKVENTDVVIADEVLEDVETTKDVVRVEEVGAQTEDERVDTGEKEVEELHISASKYAVLSVDEEEGEGEIMETGLQSGAETQGTNGNNEEGKEGPVEKKIKSWPLTLVDPPESSCLNQQVSCEDPRLARNENTE
ncbi:hypothetical protein YC2023_059057 [Brassica napus]